METIFTIEFIRLMEGRHDPAVLEVINAPMPRSDLDAVVRHALGLRRPEGASGFQVRENGGPVRNTTLFQV
jgi:hypothetical protein